MTTDKIVKIGNTNYNVNEIYNVDKNLCEIEKNSDFSGESIFLQDTGAERKPGIGTVDYESVLKYAENDPKLSEYLKNAKYNNVYNIKIDGSKKLIIIDDQKGDNDMTNIIIGNEQYTETKELEDGFKLTTVYNKNGTKVTDVIERGTENSIVTKIPDLDKN